MTTHTDPGSALNNYELNYSSATNPALQQSLEKIDRDVRDLFAMNTNDTAVGLLDLRRTRLAMIHPDREEYGASVAKIGILLAYFALRPEAATNLDSEVRHELGEMIKASDNEVAARFSREIGLKAIQAVLNGYGFYDPSRGGGLWMGKHYGKGEERYGDPLKNHSHAATVRQLLRYYLLLEQERLVSPAASRTMKEIFASPDIPHDKIKFVKGLAGRKVILLRKWGSWEDWLHDTAIISGNGRHYILVALTRHPKGDAYLEELARRVDDLMSAEGPAGAQEPD